ncbi:hypothetical protein HK101_008248 [Irineochytrium annulatum]|nr:hypothetical protein HK101_008248 [Irineochytrium annulatum]
MLSAVAITSILIASANAAALPQTGCTGGTYQCGPLNADGQGTINVCQGGSFVKLDDCNDAANNACTYISGSPFCVAGPGSSGMVGAFPAMGATPPAMPAAAAPPANTVAPPLAAVPAPLPIVPAGQAAAPAAVPSVAPAAAPAASAAAPAAPAAAGGAAMVVGTVTSGYMGTGFCSSASTFSTQLSFSTQVTSMNIANSACPAGANHIPMGECGLPTITVAVTLNGTPVSVVKYGGGNQDAAGNTFSFTLADDNPYYGGQLDLALPCAGGTPGMVGQGIAFAYSVANPGVQVQLTDGTMIGAQFVVSQSST